MSDNLKINELRTKTEMLSQTRFLICFETSSIPNVSFDIAMEMSSFAIESWVEVFNGVEVLLPSLNSG